MLTKARRVRVHAFADIKSLDEWPSVKVSILHSDLERLSHIWNLAGMGPALRNAICRSGWSSSSKAPMTAHSAYKPVICVMGMLLEIYARMC